jgi:uncharacterized protein (TIGR02266 family)
MEICLADPGRGPAGAQQRQNERFALRLPAVVVVVARDLEFAATTRNLSLGGVFLETDQELAFNTAIEVRLSPPGIAQPLAIKGRVRWVEKSDTGATGLGVQFDGLPPRDVYTLNKVLRDATR